MSNNDDNATISALIKTNKGDITTELFFKKTPVTVANFISLSEGNNKEVSEQYKGKKYTVNQHSKLVRRIFSKGSFGKGCRYYGGWWQSIGEKQREKILSNTLHERGEGVCHRFAQFFRCVTVSGGEGGGHMARKLDRHSHSHQNVRSDED